MKSPALFVLMVIVPAIAATIAYFHLDSYRVMLAYVVYGFAQMLFTCVAFAYDFFAQPVKVVREPTPLLRELLQMPADDIEMSEEDLERTWQMPVMQ
jgi:hypothetical protein